MKKNIFAIDGLTASGKGTIAKQISKYFNIPYLNTGALYRAIGFELSKLNFNDFSNVNEILKIAKSIDFTDLEREELFTEENGGWASKVAKIQEIRDFLFKMQVDFTNSPTGAVLDGRDIGTVICPDAEYKFFIVATPEERAKRRYKEMCEKNVKTSYEEILQKIKDRDYNDINRPIAPLVKAKDAIEVDTTNMNKQEVFDYILKYIHK